MSDFQEREYFLYAQQRFEAALRYCTIKCAERAGGYMDYPTYSEAITLADGLIAELEETRTKVDEDTPF